MEAREILEVCTPILSRHATTDPHVPSVCTTNERYLHTSPEFPMKRLLAAHAEAADVQVQPDIYQIAPVFRAGEYGTYHNPEFTLLEWYRVGMDHRALMDDTLQLLQHIWQTFDRPWQDAQICRYGVEVQARLGCWPEQATVEIIQAYFDQASRSFPSAIATDLDAALDLFMDEFVLPEFPPDSFTILKDYPESQAALSRLGIDEDGRCVAERFEVYYGSLELGNGFHELTDPLEQRQRFEDDLRKRKTLGEPSMPMDTLLLDALMAGMPECAGIALGLNRLQMALGGYDSIKQVLSFDDQRA